MNDSSENSLLYSDSDISVTLDTDLFSEQESILDSEDPVEDSEERSEEETGSDVEGNGQTVYGVSSSAEVVDYSDRFEHIDNTLNNLYGLAIVTLVLVGCGLVLKFIWGLLNK